MSMSEQSTEESTKKMRARYAQLTGRKERGKLLDEFLEITGGSATSSALPSNKKASGGRGVARSGVMKRLGASRATLHRQRRPAKRRKAQTRKATAGTQSIWHEKGNPPTRKRVLEPLRDALCEGGRGIACPCGRSSATLQSARRGNQTNHQKQSRYGVSIMKQHDDHLISRFCLRGIMTDE